MIISTIFLKFNIFLHFLKIDNLKDFNLILKEKIDF
jgi:hypothetical protein